MAEGESAPSEGLAPEILEKLRNRLSMDKECNWYYVGEPITHERTLGALHVGLGRDPEGRLIVRIGSAWSYVSAEDAPYAVRAVREKADPPGSFDLLLSDGTAERLDPAALAVGADNVLYGKVKEGREEARFLRPAYYQLAAHIAQDETGGFVLEAGGRRYPIGRRAARP